MIYKMMLEIILFLLITISNIEANQGTLESTNENGEQVHHRNTRSLESQFFAEDGITYSCDTSTLQQPTDEYPVILFENVNYNECSRNGKFLRLRVNTFERWSANLAGANRSRNHKWRSMLMIPGANITFRACCPSGNNFVSTVSNWNKTADIHLSLMSHAQLKGSTGIWYERWLYWMMSFYLRIDEPLDTSSSIPVSCGACYFGQCGMTGKCECAEGFQGADCGTRPSTDTYPTEKKPLVLFTEEEYKGTHLPVNPNDFKRFAYNVRESRQMIYKSFRVLHNRTVTFSRNIIFKQTYTPGASVSNIAEFMLANTNIGDGVWYNYDMSYEVDFYVRVEPNDNCFNCTMSNAVCYTGSCLCKQGFTGENCDVSS